MLKSYSMSFDGHLLERGFWLYVWDIRGSSSRQLYVGRTGDTSSPNAQSPFWRIGQYLDPRPNAKGNALAQQLGRAGIDSSTCSFEMTAVGPIFPEQESFEEHRPPRDQMAALERALAERLRGRGYDVLGTHPRAATPDAELFRQVCLIVDPKFPQVVEA
jgi:hypothetical protein